jgi:cytochrome bd ubiquinol oxidase subunit II
MIAAMGIVLQGASFAFRKVLVTTRNRRLFGAAFAISSMLVLLHASNTEIEKSGLAG